VSTLNAHVPDSLYLLVMTVLSTRPVCTSSRIRSRTAVSVSKCFMESGTDSTEVPRFLRGSSRKVNVALLRFRSLSSVVGNFRASGEPGPRFQSDGKGVFFIKKTIDDSLKHSLNTGDDPRPIVVSTVN